jgi:hypothetical protein
VANVAVENLFGRSQLAAGRYYRTVSRWVLPSNLPRPLLDANLAGCSSSVTVSASTSEIACG